MEFYKSLDGDLVMETENIHLGDIEDQGREATQKDWLAKASLGFEGGCRIGGMMPSEARWKDCKE